MGSKTSILIGKLIAPPHRLYGKWATTLATSKGFLRPLRIG